MDTTLRRALRQAVDADTAFDATMALAVLQTNDADLPEVLAAANAVRLRHFGNRVHLCSILNAKSGACREDCAFCAQSVYHQTQTPTYALSAVATIRDAYDDAAALPIGHFGVVTSGGTLDDAGIAQVCESIQHGGSCAWCASLGCLDEAQLRQLKAAGLQRFHHNLETAESFFPSICSTHTYAERLRTVHAVKAAGLQLCCGGILGLGESLEQRVEFALTLAREGVDAIPLNFLVPVAGTRLQNLPAPTPTELLRAVAMFRLTNAPAEIKVCAGRLHLRDLQSMIFAAGATGMMIGPLLTIAGRDVETDLQMLADLGVQTH